MFMQTLTTYATIKYIILTVIAKYRSINKKIYKANACSKLKPFRKLRKKVVFICFNWLQSRVYAKTNYNFLLFVSIYINYTCFKVFSLKIQRKMFNIQLSNV